MPRFRPHPEYTRRLPDWQRCRDCHEGEMAIKAHGAAYVPRLHGQSEDQFRAYVERGEFFPGFARMVGGFSGLLTAQDITLTFPDRLAVELHDVTTSGISFQSLTAQVARELWITGRIGLLINYAELAARPRWQVYQAEQIWNWEVGVDRDGYESYLWVLLYFEGEGLAPDGTPEVVKHWVEHDARPSVGGVWTIRHWKQTPRDGEPVQIPVGTNPEGDFVPQRSGQPLSYIPFHIANASGFAVDPDKPLLLDAAHLSISMFRNSCDLENGAHWAGVPTPVITGHEFAPGEVVKLGSGEALTMSEPDAKAFFLEFQGQGLGVLENLIARKQANLAAIGARFLEAPKGGVESADTLRVRMGAELASLNDVAGSLEQLLIEALRDHVRWQTNSDDLAEEVSASIRRNFVAIEMDASELRETVNAWMQGAISYETLFTRLQRGGIIHPDRVLTDEDRATQAEGMRGAEPPISAPGASAENL